MVCPLTSRIERNGDLAVTHQNVSPDPVELAPMMRMGAPLPKAPRLPSTPALSPISTDPETTTCSVSPPPCVYRISRSRPCLRTMPACLPSSGIAPSQLPRMGEAILSVSAASPCGIANVTSAAAVAAVRLRKDIAFLPFRTARSSFRRWRLARQHTALDTPRQAKSAHQRLLQVASRGEPALQQELISRAFPP